jgi:hypothetical protein
MKDAPMDSFAGSSRLFARGAMFLPLAMIAMLITAATLSAQTKSKVTIVSADAGSCSADFLVQGAGHKPLYGVKIDLKFRYGFLGLHRISLEAYTDQTGRVRFEGLPRQPKNAYVFQISHGNAHDSVIDDPTSSCNAQYTVVLEGNSGRIEQVKTGTPAAN